MTLLKKSLYYNTDSSTNGPAMNLKSRILICSWVHRAESCSVKKIFGKCISESGNFLPNAEAADELWESTSC